jgi:hypothetical protein
VLLPNAHLAAIDPQKLHGYLLSKTHPVGRFTRKARDRVVLRHWRSATDQVGELRHGGVAREDLTVSSITTTEPFVMQYALDAFVERSDEDPIEIGDEEFWHTVAVTLTLIETLHEMAGAERQSV